MRKALTKKPILYIFIYYIQRKRMGNKTGRLFCTIKDFRIRLSHLGIRKNLSKAILLDMKRYNFVKDINFKNGQIEFRKTSEDADLFKDIISMRREGLL